MFSCYEILVACPSQNKNTYPDCDAAIPCFISLASQTDLHFIHGISVLKGIGRTETTGDGIRIYEDHKTCLNQAKYIFGHYIAEGIELKRDFA